MADSYTYSIDGLDAVLRSFGQLDTELRRNANGDLRAASKQIGVNAITMLGGSGAPQEGKILAATAPKSDRYVVIAAPNRKPALSGLKRTPARLAKTMGWAVETGSKHTGGRVGKMVASHIPAIQARAIPEYQKALANILREYRLI